MRRLIVRSRCWALVMSQVFENPSSTPPASGRFYGGFFATRPSNRSLWLNSCDHARLVYRVADTKWVRSFVTDRNRRLGSLQLWRSRASVDYVRFWVSQRENRRKTL